MVLIEDYGVVSMIALVWSSMMVVMWSKMRTMIVLI